MKPRHIVLITAAIAATGSPALAHSVRHTAAVEGADQTAAVAAANKAALQQPSATAYLNAIHVVDRLFAVAELRLGERHQDVVRIARQGAAPSAHAAVAFAGSARGGGHD